MNNILSLLDIDQYVATTPLLNAKKVVFSQCFSLEGSSSFVVIEGGLQSSKERELLDNMLNAFNKCLGESVAEQQWRTASSLLLLACDIEHPQLDTREFLGATTVCFHPRELLEGSKKKQAYDKLVEFFHPSS